MLPDVTVFPLLWVKPLGDSLSFFKFFIKKRIMNIIYKLPSINETRVAVKTLRINRLETNFHNIFKSQHFLFLLQYVPGLRMFNILTKYTHSYTHACTYTLNWVCVASELLQAEPQ